MYNTCTIAPIRSWGESLGARLNIKLYNTSIIWPLDVGKDHTK